MAKARSPGDHSRSLARPFWRGPGPGGPSLPKTDVCQEFLKRVHITDALVVRAPEEARAFTDGMKLEGLSRKLMRSRAKESLRPNTPSLFATRPGP